MAEPINWDALFVADGTKVVALSDGAAVAHNPEVSDSTAAVFVLLDQRTKKPTGQHLYVAISPGTAIHLAKELLKHAKANGWLPGVSSINLGPDPKRSNH
jgi:hypothetical protein